MTQVRRVFISSTSEDLEKYRIAARDAVIAAGCLPVMMEYFTPQGELKPLEGCLREVETCDLITAMVAHRYGWVPAGGTKSITWLECERAKEVVAFLASWRVSEAIKTGKYTPELAAEVTRNVEQLRELKAWLNSNGFRGTFTNPDVLKMPIALALLDGLDEAPDRGIRERMARLFENATQRYPECRFVVTTRHGAYEGLSTLGGFDAVKIDELSDDGVEVFLGHWANALHPSDAAVAAAYRKELLGAVRARPAIRRMARNPVMLTALAVLQWNDKRLPEQRAELYESILMWLARAREKPGRERAEICLRRSVRQQQLVLRGVGGSSDGWKSTSRAASQGRNRALPPRQRIRRGFSTFP